MYAHPIVWSKPFIKINEMNKSIGLYTIQRRVIKIENKFDSLYYGLLLMYLNMTENSYFEVYSSVDYCITINHELDFLMQ